jgi:hypothetical protein
MLPGGFSTRKPENLASQSAREIFGLGEPLRTRLAMEMDSRGANRREAVFPSLVSEVLFVSLSRASMSSLMVWRTMLAGEREYILAL